MSRSDFGLSDQELKRSSGGRLLPSSVESGGGESAIPFDEADLLDYGRMLWARRRMILLGTVAAALFGAGLAAVLPKTYRGNATLLIAESKMWTSEEERKDIPPQKYLEIVRSRTVASRVVRDLNLTQQSYRYDEERLLDRLRVVPIEGTPMLRVLFDARDPVMAREITNSIVAHAVALNRSLSTSDAAAADAFVKEQLQDAVTRYDTAESALRTFAESAKLEELRTLVGTELDLKEDLSLQFAQVEQDISRMRGSVESMTAELKGQEKVLDLVKSVSDDPTFRQAVQGASSADLERMLTVRMTSEEINPLFREIEPKLVEGLGDIAGWGRQRDTIRKSLAENTQRLGALQQELARKEAQYERLKTMYDVEQETYKTLSRKQAEVRLLMQVKDADLQVVDPAVRPSRHIRPKVWLYSTLIGTIAFVLLALLALVLEYARSRRSTAAAGAPPRPIAEVAATR